MRNNLIGCIHTSHASVYNYSGIIDDPPNPPQTEKKKTTYLARKSSMRKEKCKMMVTLKR